MGVHDEEVRYLPRVTDGVLHLTCHVPTYPTEGGRHHRGGSIHRFIEFTRRHWCIRCKTHVCLEGVAGRGTACVTEGCWWLSSTVSRAASKRTATYTRHTSSSETNINDATLYPEAGSGRSVGNGKVSGGFGSKRLKAFLLFITTLSILLLLIRVILG